MRSSEFLEIFRTVILKNSYVGLLLNVMIAYQIAKVRIALAKQANDRGNHLGLFRKNKSPQKLTCWINFRKHFMKDWSKLSLVCEELRNVGGSGLYHLYHLMHYFQKRTLWSLFLHEKHFFRIFLQQCFSLFNIK